LSYKEIIKKLKESGTVTFGEFHDLVKLDADGKLDREEQKILQKEMDKFRKLITRIPPSLKNFLDMSKVNPTLKLLANLENTALGKQLKKAQELSNEILTDITTLKISDEDIPQPVIDKSIKLENQMSDITESLNQLNTNTEQIKEQTKPPTKHEKWMNRLEGIFIGIVCSIIAGVILFLSFSQ